MRISNIASYTGFADKYNNLNNFTSRKNYSFGRDVLSFGKREDAAPADESAADDDKGTKKSKGKKKKTYGPNGSFIACRNNAYGYRQRSDL